MTRYEMLEETTGYAPHFNAIDSECVSEWKCEKGHAQHYRGFKLSGSYRAFTVCDICDSADEF